MRLKITFIGLMAALLLIVSGCACSTRARLPANVHTISVSVFGNSTEYLSIEGKLTNAIVAEINRSPSYKVVNDGADAELSGKIVEVRQSILEYDANNQPRNVQITARAKYSLYDRANSGFLMENAEASSSQSSTLAGRYYTDNGDSADNATDAALQELARVIVRDIMMSGGRHAKDAADDIQ